MTSRVTNLELGAIRRFTLQRCDPCSISCWMDSDISLAHPGWSLKQNTTFLKGYEGSDGWKFLRSPSSTIPFPFICSARGVRFFFLSNSTVPPPQKKNNPELLCVNGDCIAALFIGTSFHPCRMITIQGSDFPQAAWKFPRDSQREIPPVVGSYSEQHQAALQKRGGGDLAGRLRWTSPGVKHQIRGFACSLALV